jgi:hypothetical protein
MLVDAYRVPEIFDAHVHIFNKEPINIINYKLMSLFNEIKQYDVGNNILIVADHELLEHIYVNILNDPRNAIFANCQIKKVLLCKYDNKIEISTNKQKINDTLLIKINILLDYLKKKNKTLTSDELYEILYYILSNDICNFYLIYKFISLLILHIQNNPSYLEINSDDLFFYKCKQYLIDTFFCEYVYFNKITYFMKKNYKVFSFDNSLNKFNLFWNLKNPDYQIKNIPYENIFENNNFKLMIDLLSNKHNILLIDHICSNKSIYTIILAVNSINPSLLETLEILYIVNSDFDKDLHFNQYFNRTCIFIKPN